MALANVSELALLALLFQNTAWANVGNTGGLQPSSVAGNLYVALHTASPTAAGNQTSSEAAYTNYARVAVVRSGSGWTSSGSSPTQMANTAATTFPQSGSGPESETFFSVGTASTGTGSIIYFGALSATLVVNNLVTPSFAIGALVLTML